MFVLGLKDKANAKGTTPIRVQATFLFIAAQTRPRAKPERVADVAVGLDAWGLEAVNRKARNLLIIKANHA